MFRVDFEMLPGIYPRPSKNTWTIDMAHQIVHDAIERGGYKDIKIYDLDRPCGDFFFIEHYFLGRDGWDVD